MNIKTHGSNTFSVTLAGDRFVNIYVKGNEAEIEPCSHAEQVDISKAQVVAAWEAVRDKFSLVATPTFKEWHQTIPYYPQVAWANDGLCGYPASAHVKDRETTRDGRGQEDEGRYSHPMSVEKN